MNLSWGRLFLMAMSNFAVQYTYTVLFGFGVPYFRSLGVPYIFIPFIGALAPVCGFVIQPIAGYYSDKSSNSWGKRRPFIAMGAIITSIGMIILSLAIFIGQRVFHDDRVCMIGVGNNSTIVCTGSLIMSALGLCVVIFSTNIMEGQAKAIMSDLVPNEQQTQAFFVVATMMGLANLVANLAVFFTPTYIPFFGENFVFFFLIGVVVHFICASVTCYMCVEDVTSKDTVIEPVSSSTNSTRTGTTQPYYTANYNGKQGQNETSKNFLAGVMNSARKLGNEFLYILFIYFICWLAYTPMLNFVTDWFGKTVFGGEGRGDQVYDEGCRYGFLSVAAQAVCTIISSFIGPVMVTKVGTRNWFGITQIVTTTSYIFLYFIDSNWPVSQPYVIAILVSAIPGINLSAFTTIPFALLSKNRKRNLPDLSSVNVNINLDVNDLSLPLTKSKQHEYARELAADATATSPGTSIENDNLGVDMGLLNSGCVVAESVGVICTSALITFLNNDNSSIFIVAFIASAIATISIFALVPNDK